MNDFQERLEFSRFLDRQLNIMFMSVIVILSLSPVLLAAALIFEASRKEAEPLPMEVERDE